MIGGQVKTLTLYFELWKVVRYRVEIHKIWELGCARCKRKTQDRRVLEFHVFTLGVH
jgi:hypothetical protein